MTKKLDTVRQPSETRLRLLTRVAELYYEQGLTQEGISAELGYSRSAISRLLTEAREVGIVEITIHYPPCCKDR